MFTKFIPDHLKTHLEAGIGDIYGIIEKLDYIKSLGVNMIWILSHFIVHQMMITDTIFQTTEKLARNLVETKAFDILLEEMHKRDLKLIMDLVANHSSDEHRWFEESKKGEAEILTTTITFGKREKGNPLQIIGFLCLVVLRGNGILI